MRRRLPILALVAVIAVLVALILFLLTRPPIIIPAHPSGTIITLKDSTGTEEINVFLPSDNVYVKGSGMPKKHQYNIYIITDTTIIDGMHIPTNVTTAVTVTTDENGAFPPTLIWSAPLKPGYYDIIADCLDGGAQGYYDSPDAIDDEEINVTAGFFVVHELPLGTLMAVVAPLAAVAGLATKRLQLKQ